MHRLIAVFILLTTATATATVDIPAYPDRPASPTPSPQAPVQDDSDGASELLNVSCALPKKGSEEGNPSSGFSRNLGPLKFSAGPIASGGAGASLAGGDSIWLSSLTDCSGGPNQDTLGWNPIARIFYGVDGQLSSDADSLNTSSLSFRPTIDFHLLHHKPYKVSERSALSTKAEGELGPGEGLALLKGGAANGQKFSFAVPLAVVSAFADLRYRFGEVDDGVGGIIRANQFIYGAGLEFAWSAASRVGAVGHGPRVLFGFFRDAPRVRLGYYSADDVNGNEAPVPAELTADYVTVVADIDIALPWFGRSLAASPLVAHYEYKGSDPTKGGTAYSSYHNSQLAYLTGGDIKPVISYKSGKEQGLKYDRQVIIGILWELDKL